MKVKHPKTLNPSRTVVVGQIPVGFQICYLDYLDTLFPSNNNELGLFLGYLQGEDASTDGKLPSL